MSKYVIRRDSLNSNRSNVRYLCRSEELDGTRVTAKTPVSFNKPSEMERNSRLPVRFSNRKSAESFISKQLYSAYDQFIYDVVPDSRIAA